MGKQEKKSNVLWYIIYIFKCKYSENNESNVNIRYAIFASLFGWISCSVSLKLGYTWSRFRYSLSWKQYIYKFYTYHPRFFHLKRVWHFRRISRQNSAEKIPNMRGFTSSSDLITQVRLTLTGHQGCTCWHLFYGYQIKTSRRIKMCLSWNYLAI